MELRPILFLIDDDTVDQEIIRRALVAEGINVDLLVIGAGHQAASRVKEHLSATSSGRSSLVMLDLNMPGESGFEVLARLRADPATHFLPVVVFTTSSDRDDVARAYALGATSYVVKPSSFAELRRTLRIIIDYWFGVTTGSSARGPSRPA